MRARRGFAQQKRGVPSRPLLFVTCRFCYTRYAREVWRRAGLLVAEILGKLRFPYRFLDFGNASELALPKSASRWSPVLFF